MFSTYGDYYYIEAMIRYQRFPAAVSETLDSR